MGGGSYMSIETYQKNLFSQIKEDLKEKGRLRLLNLLRESTYSFESIEAGNWGNPEIFVLHIYLHLPVLNRFSVDEIKQFEDEVEKSACRLFNDQDAIIDKVKISQQNEFFIDWDVLNGIATKQELVTCLEKERDFLVSAGTGTQFSDIEAAYSENHRQLVMITGALSIDLPVVFSSLWDWYSFYKNASNKVSTYADRRAFILSKYNETIEAVDKSYIRSDYVAETYRSGWEEIDESFERLQKEIGTKQDRLGLNAIGERCRGTIVLLAQQVYQEKYHASFLPP